VVDQFVAWARAQELAGATVEVMRLPQRTPLIVIDVTASEQRLPVEQQTVLLYGHADKQVLQFTH
jgi:hypothetical protein